MAQAPDKSPTQNLYRFKVAKTLWWAPLPEAKYVCIAQNGLNIEIYKKFLDMNFLDMYELAEQVE